MKIVNKEEVQIKEIVKKETTKPKLLVPKKKPLIAGKTKMKDGQILGDPEGTPLKFS